MGWILDLAAVFVLAGSWFWLYSGLRKKVSKNTALVVSLVAAGLVYAIGAGIASFIPIVSALKVPVGAAAVLGFNAVIAVPVVKQLRGGHGSK
jgi:hypothetical protein